VSALRLVLRAASLSAGDEVVGAVAREGAPSSRAVFVGLERKLLRRGGVAMVRSDLVAERRLVLGEDGEAPLAGLRLPVDAFTYEGEEAVVRWAVVAREEGGDEAARVALDVSPAVCRVEDRAESLQSIVRARQAERRRERWRVVGHLLWMALALALPAFSVVAVGAPIWARLGGLLPAVVAWMLWSTVVWPILKRWRALKAGPPSPALLCGERLTVPDPPGRPSWRLVRVERVSFTTRRYDSEGSRREVTNEEHKDQLLAEGQGPATLQISPFGPPTFDEAGLSIEHELRFFHPDRPDDVVITQLTVAPGRVA
jgi:hypothetical protein